MLTSQKNNLVVIDVETSGINPFKNEILAIAIVPFNKSIPDCLVYVRSLNIEWSIYAKNNFEKFKDEWELNAVSPIEACERIEAYLSKEFNGEKVTAIGHNIGFDVSFIRKLAYLAGKDEIKGLSHRVIDTHTILYLLNQRGKIPSASLTSDGAFNYFDIKFKDSERHTALGDATATRKLALKLFEINSN